MELRELLTRLQHPAWVHSRSIPTSLDTDETLADLSAAAKLVSVMVARGVKDAADLDRQLTPMTLGYCDYGLWPAK